jgi:hypothetical protein
MGQPFNFKGPAKKKNWNLILAGNYEISKQFVLKKNYF